VNVMKCSKNVLGLILVACECVGERADTYSMPLPADIHDGGAYAASMTAMTTLTTTTTTRGCRRSLPSTSRVERGEGEEEDYR
jgi:hypothetical protein